MISILGVTGKSFLVAGLVLGITLPFETAHAAKFHLLHVFQGGSDGASPFGALLKGTAVRYGTTYYGGTNNLGTVFQIARDGTESVVHSFTGGSDGDRQR